MAARGMAGEKDDRSTLEKKDDEENFLDNILQKTV
jgi:hypothetical protein